MSNAPEDEATRAAKRQRLEADQAVQSLRFQQLSQLCSAPLLAPCPMDGLVTEITDNILRYLHQPELELEIRLGRMMENGRGGSGGGGRLNLPISTPALLTKNCQHRLDASVLPDAFEKIKGILKNAATTAFAPPPQGGAEGGQGNLQSHQQQMAVPLFIATDVAMEDHFYSDGVRKSFSLATTKDKEGEQQQQQCLASIKKDKVMVLDIVVPSQRYDVRICLSKEIPSESKPDASVKFKRKKFRTTFRSTRAKIPVSSSSGVVSGDNNKGVKNEENDESNNFTFGSIVELTKVVEGNGRETCEVEIEATCLKDIVDLTKDDPKARHFLISRLTSSLLSDGMFLAAQCK